MKIKFLKNGSYKRHKEKSNRLMIAIDVRLRVTFHRSLLLDKHLVIISTSLSSFDFPFPVFLEHLKVDIRLFLFSGFVSVDMSRW